MPKYIVEATVCDKIRSKPVDSKKEAEKLKRAGNRVLGTKNAKVIRVK